MKNIPTVTPILPGSEELERYRLLAEQPRASIEHLSSLLMTLRAHAASIAAFDPVISRGIFREVAHVALRLATLRSTNPDQFRQKAAAIQGLQFLDEALDAARAIQLLMTVEAKRLGINLETMTVHDASPTNPTLNS